MSFQRKQQLKRHTREMQLVRTFSTDTHDMHKSMCTRMSHSDHLSARASASDLRSAFSWTRIQEIPANHGYFPWPP